MGIPIPKTLVIWASPSHITLAIWVRVRVRVTGDAHIARILGMGMLKTRGYPYHCHTGASPVAIVGVFAKVLSAQFPHRSQINFNHKQFF